jgi:hypothetical protein
MDVKDLKGNLDSLRKIVGNTAPLLGSVLGSSFYGVGLTLLANLFGGNIKNIPDLIEKIKADGLFSDKLSNLENEHCETLEKIASADFAKEVEDRKDARTYTAHYRDFLKHLAYLVTAGFFAALFLLFAPIDTNDEGKHLLSMLVGMLASKWQTIIDFFFGSSRHQGLNFNKEN